MESFQPRISPLRYTLPIYAEEIGSHAYPAYPSHPAGRKILSPRILCMYVYMYVVAGKGGRGEGGGLILKQPILRGTGKLHISW